MQTFLPYPDISKSLISLDYRRLGKQRVEARQIYNIITGQAKSNAWANHPAVRMWRGYEGALGCYHNICIMEWIRRGYKNTMPLLDLKDILFPPWFGDKSFHDSHKSNLLRKDYDYYSQYQWDVPNNLEYVWPV